MGEIRGKVDSWVNLAEKGNVKGARMSETQKDGPKMHHVKMPESVYQLLLEVRRQLAAAGTQCYHRSESGQIVHGAFDKAPAHATIEFSLQNTAQGIHPERESVIAGFDARRAYLAGFQED